MSIKCLRSNNALEQSGENRGPRLVAARTITVAACSTQPLGRNKNGIEIHYLG